MMLLQQGPADTFSYMVLGYAVILITMGLYVVSLIVRRNNLNKDLQLLEELDLDD